MITYKDLSTAEKRMHGWGKKGYLVDFRTAKRNDALVLSWIEGYEGVLAMGKPGTGKTNSIGNTIMVPMLAEPVGPDKFHVGGCFLTFKNDVIHEVTDMARFCGRSDDLLILDENTPYQMMAEIVRTMKVHERTDVMSRYDGYAEAAENLAGRLALINESLGGGGSGGGGQNDGFFKEQCNLLTKNGVLCLYMGDEFCRSKNPKYKASTLYDLYRLLNSAPTKDFDEEDKTRFARERIQYAKSFLAHVGGGKLPSDVIDYFEKNFYSYPTTTRGNLLQFAENLLARFCSGPLQRTFCQESAFHMEDAVDGGKILLVGYDIASRESVGTIANIVAKLEFQAAVKKRIAPKYPCFLVADEFQKFVSKGSRGGDSDFVQISRSYKCMPFFLTQNLPGLVSALGNDEIAAKNLIGNLKTKIFARNDCTDTSEWVCKMFKAYQTQENVSLSMETGAKENVSVSQQEISSLSPAHFLKLSFAMQQYNAQYDILGASTIFVNSHAMREQFIPMVRIPKPAERKGTWRWIYSRIGKAVDGIKAASAVTALILLAIVGNISSSASETTMVRIVSGWAGTENQPAVFQAMPDCQQDANRIHQHIQSMIEISDYRTKVRQKGADLVRPAITFSDSGMDADMFFRHQAAWVVLCPSRRLTFGTYTDLGRSITDDPDKYFLRGKFYGATSTENKLYNCKNTAHLFSRDSFHSIGVFHFGCFTAENLTNPHKNLTIAVGPNKYSLDTSDWRLFDRILSISGADTDFSKLTTWAVNQTKRTETFWTDVEGTQWDGNLTVAHYGDISGKGVMPAVNTEIKEQQDKFSTTLTELRNKWRERAVNLYFGNNGIIMPTGAGNL